MNALRRLALREAFSRLPETCPAVHTAGSEASTSFFKWLHRTDWHGELSDAQAERLSHRIGELIRDITDAVKENATKPLRDQFVTAIEERLQISLTPERLQAIEGGTDENESIIQ